MSPKTSICPHCNKEVKRIKHKDVAEGYKCLECDGNYIMDPYGRPKKSMSDKGNVTIGFMALIAIIGICVYTCYPDDESKTVDTTQEQSEAGEKLEDTSGGGGLSGTIPARFRDDLNEANFAFNVSAVDMMAEWYKNKVRWHANYMDKTGKVTGIINDIGMNVFDEPYLTLKTDDAVWEIRCTFENPADIQDLEKGQSVSVEGEVWSDLGDISLKNCKLVK